MWRRAFEWLLIAVIIVIVVISALTIVYICLRKKSPKLITKTKSSSIGEAKCREVLEGIFGRKFPNVRPAWLKNESTGRNLEIDCYDQERGLFGVEYDGEGHYLPVYGEEKLKSQRKRDSLKDELCKKRGFQLIRVPFTEKNRIEEYLRAELKRRKLLPTRK